MLKLDRVKSRIAGYLARENKVPRRISVHHTINVELYDDYIGTRITPCEELFPPTLAIQAVSGKTPIR